MATSAVCAGDFGREGGGRGRGLVGDRKWSVKEAGVSLTRYPSRSSISEPAYLGKTIAVAGEINHPLWMGQDLPEGGEKIVVRIRDFFVLCPVFSIKPTAEVSDAKKRFHSF